MPTLRARWYPRRKTALPREQGVSAIADRLPGVIAVADAGAIVNVMHRVHVTG